MLVLRRYSVNLADTLTKKGDKMNKGIVFAALAVSMGLTGCVKQEEYDALQAKLTQTESELAQSKKEAEDLKSDLAKEGAKVTATQGLLEEVQAQSAKLSEQLSDSEKTVSSLKSEIAKLKPMLESARTAADAAKDELQSVKAEIEERFEKIKMDAAAKVSEMNDKVEALAGDNNKLRDYMVSHFDQMKPKTETVEEAAE